MAEITSLPTEIIRHIFSYADQESQKALRLTTRRLGAIGQQSVFQTLSVCPTEESYGRLESILRRADLVPYINKIYLNTYDPRNPPESQYDDEKDADSQYGDEKNVASRLFSYLKEMPELQSVAVRFHWECPEEHGHAQQDESFRSEVMQEGLKALAAIPGLKEFTLRDMYNVNETDPEIVANRNKILPRLKSLRLNITNRVYPQKFFLELPSVWLEPCLSNLQHLTLYSSIYIGFAPKCDLRGLHFPKLKTLAFGNYTFIHDSQLDWILSHAATLTALYLDDCAIVHEAATFSDSVKQGQTLLAFDAFRPHPHLPENELYTSYATRWADYFRAFKDKLVNLRDFRYGSAPNWWEDETTPFESEQKIRIGFGEESYLAFECGLLSSEYTEYLYWRIPKEGVAATANRRDYIEDVRGEKLEASEDDEKALEELCTKVGLSWSVSSSEDE